MVLHLKRSAKNLLQYGYNTATNAVPKFFILFVGKYPEPELRHSCTKLFKVKGWLRRKLILFLKTRILCKNYIAVQGINIEAQKIYYKCKPA